MLPILYSFRRCPFAIRARLALQVSKTSYELREIKLRDKPSCLLAASPKGSVPVLVLSAREVIDESWDIMRWALRRHDPSNWLGRDGAHLDKTAALVAINDGSFKTALDGYKYPERYPKHSSLYYRTAGEVFLQQLETRLQTNAYLLGDHFSIADAALIPFIRQFAGVDPVWFAQSPYPRLRNWSEALINSVLFKTAMQKQAVWQAGQIPVVIPDGK